jgi:hypothetical protein
MEIVVDGKKYCTDKMADVGGGWEVGLGVTLTGIWLTPRSKKVIVQHHSQWEDSYGYSYHIAEPDEIAHLASKTGSKKLLALVPEGDG